MSAVESDTMLDLSFYRDGVLEIIVCGLHVPREVYELRFALFLRAYFYQHVKRETILPKQKSDVLQPFPFCFYDTKTKQTLNSELERCLLSIPNLREINESTSLTELTWQLLHWIFTNPLLIEYMEESAISDYMTNELRKESQLKSIPYPSKQCKRFRIYHPEINSQGFRNLKYEFGTFYAFHGSPSYNFHSIIHNGLLCELNERQAFGPGTYLTSDFETAKSYARQHGFDSESSNAHKLRNPSGIKFCIAIVEVIKHKSINVVHFDTRTTLATRQELLKKSLFDTSSDDERYYVVKSNKHMRLAHLLAFY